MVILLLFASSPPHPLQLHSDSSQLIAPFQFKQETGRFVLNSFILTYYTYPDLKKKKNLESMNFSHSPLLVLVLALNINHLNHFSSLCISYLLLHNKLP